jgi:GNAT superfamily N-acetyltransferase
MFEISEVDATTPKISAILHGMNGRSPDLFPPLLERHLESGFWWLAMHERNPVGFAGLVAMEPFANVGYLKRCYVMPDHRGHGLQYRLLMARELKARQLGWSTLVSETKADNTHSASNFRKAGFEQCEPEQKWARDSIYWVKHLF